MNPPFSAGAAHLLKALDVMKDGGKIRCLLNAETIRNPCTNERKELAAQLEKLNATVKYIPDAFKNARRAARVEVALVSVDIPEREPVSKIRLELQHEATERLKTDPELAALVSADPSRQPLSGTTPQLRHPPNLRGIQRDQIPVFLCHGRRQ